MAECISKERWAKSVDRMKCQGVGCMSGNDVDSLYQIKGIIDSNFYLEMLDMVT